MKNHNKLTIQEREEIFRLSTQNHLSIRKIGKLMNRNHSVISRELRRKGMTRSTYSVAEAQVDRNIKASQVGVKKKIDPTRKLYHTIKHQLVELRWSPEQISNRLKKESKSTRWRVSHETIYQYIYSMKDLTEKKIWIKSLRRKKAKRGPCKAQRGKGSKIPNRVSIHERPKEILDRTEIGHWEGDLIVGVRHQSAIGTLVERTSRKTIIVSLPEGKSSEQVVMAFEKKLEALPPYLRKTLTYDNGTEMSSHELLSNSLGIKVYFCDPGCPGQRGTNENTNGLIRDFFPKKTDFSKVSEDQLRHVEKLLNERPRKILGYENPETIFWRDCGPEPPIIITPTPERRGEQR
jgi:transposase, IS30 family